MNNAKYKEVSDDEFQSLMEVENDESFRPDSAAHEMISGLRFKNPKNSSFELDLQLTKDNTKSLTRYISKSKMIAKIVIYQIYDSMEVQKTYKLRMHNSGKYFLHTKDNSDNQLLLYFKNDELVSTRKNNSKYPLLFLQNQYNAIDNNNEQKIVTKPMYLSLGKKILAVGKNNFVKFNTTNDSYIVCNQDDVVHYLNQNTKGIMETLTSSCKLYNCLLFLDRYIAYNIKKDADAKIGDLQFCNLKQYFEILKDSQKLEQEGVVNYQLQLSGSVDTVSDFKMKDKEIKEAFSLNKEEQISIEYGEQDKTEVFIDVKSKLQIQNQEEEISNQIKFRQKLKYTVEEFLKK